MTEVADAPAVSKSAASLGYRLIYLSVGRPETEASDGKHLFLASELWLANDVACGSDFGAGGEK